MKNNPYIWGDLKREREREREKEKTETENQTLVEYIEMLHVTRQRAGSEYSAYICLPRMRNYSGKATLPHFSIQGRLVTILVFQ